MDTRRLTLARHSSEALGRIREGRSELKFDEDLR